MIYKSSGILFLSLHRNLSLLEEMHIFEFFNLIILYMRHIIWPGFGLRSLTVVPQAVSMDDGVTERAPIAIACSYCDR